MLFNINSELSGEFSSFKYADQYLKELKLTKTVKKGGNNNSTDVKKVTEWLELWKYLAKEYGIIDPIKQSSYNNTAVEAVKILQREFGISVTGEVDQETFFLLTYPMTKAFQKSLVDPFDIREAILIYAEQHMACYPLETSSKIDNQGPWARAYLDVGATVSDSEWCAGFISTIYDQAFSHFGEDYVPFTSSKRTAWVPNIAQFAFKNDLMIPYDEIGERIDEVKPGDLFMIYDPDIPLWETKGATRKYRYRHIGIVKEIVDNTMISIEGNKNFDDKTLQKQEKKYEESIPAKRGGVFSVEYDLSSPDNNISVFSLNI